MTQQPKGRKPTHVANAVREYGDGKAEWIKIGVAWATSNGGFNAHLYATPWAAGWCSPRPRGDRAGRTPVHPNGG
ncbi:MAG: hypothetical protein C0501_26460 [Isosphaera sp.]|nr:hypothetical protein [Isosphaera sp.]